jgi:hypothetical protein
VGRPKTWDAPLGTGEIDPYREALFPPAASESEASARSAPVLFRTMIIDGSTFLLTGRDEQAGRTSTKTRTSTLATGERSIAFTEDVVIISSVIHKKKQ